MANALLNMLVEMSVVLWPVQFVYPLGSGTNTSTNPYATNTSTNPYSSTNTSTNPYSSNNTTTNSNTNNTSYGGLTNLGLNNSSNSNMLTNQIQPRQPPHQPPTNTRAYNPLTSHTQHNNSTLSLNMRMGMYTVFTVGFCRVCGQDGSPYFPMISCFVVITTFSYVFRIYLAIQKCDINQNFRGQP